MEDILITLAIMSYMASLVVWLKWTRPSLGADQTPISTRGTAVGAQFEDIKRAKKAGQKNKKTPIYVHLQISLLSLTALFLIALVVYFFI